MQHMTLESALELVHNDVFGKEAAIFLAVRDDYEPDSPEMLLRVFRALHDGKDPDALSCLRGQVWDHCRVTAGELSLWA